MLLQACRSENPPLYSYYQTLDPECWDAEYILAFDPMPSDSVMPEFVDVTVGLRHAQSFPYQKIWLKIDRFSDNAEIFSDTVAVNLADSKGFRLGKGYYGLYEINDTIWRHISSKEISHVEISHIMEEEKLPGIYNLGLIVNRSR